MNELNITAYRPDEGEVAMHYGFVSIRNGYYFVNANENFYEIMGPNTCYSVLELIHPDAKSEAEGLEQLIVMIDGRKVERLTCTGIQKSVNAGSNGIVHTESGSYQVLFDDGTEMALSVTYCSDSIGEGFHRFWGQMQESTPIKT